MEAPNKVFRLRPHHVERFFIDCHNTPDYISDGRNDGYDEPILRKAEDIYQGLFFRNEPFVIVPSLDDLCEVCNKRAIPELAKQLKCFELEGEYLLPRLCDKIGDVQFGRIYFPRDILQGSLQLWKDWIGELEKMGAKDLEIRNLYRAMEHSYNRLNGGL